MDPGRRRRLRPRGSPSTPSRSWARWSSSSCPRWARSSTPTTRSATIESVKAVAEIFTPVAGEIVEVNEAVVDDPELLNDDPHGEGWLLKIRFSSAADLKEPDGRREVRGLRRERRRLGGESRERADRCPSEPTAAAAGLGGGGRPPSTPPTLFPAATSAPGDDEVAAMLATLGLDSLDELIAETVPRSIRLARALRLSPPPAAAATSPARSRRARAAGPDAADGGRQPGLPLAISAWATTTRIVPPVDPAQHPREPRLVHRSTRPTRPRSRRGGSRRC